MQELRGHLFDTLRRVKSKEDPMELDRAKAVVDVAQALINTAKVEVDFIKATGASDGSGFLKAPDHSPALPPPGGGILGVTTHKLK